MIVSMMINVLVAGVAFVAGIVFGPKVQAWLKSHGDAKALAAAQALVAKAEADAKALETAKKVVAAAPTPAAPSA